MADRTLTSEAIQNLATPFFEQGQQVFIAYCPEGEGKLYMADVPSDTCKRCDVVHENYSAKTVAELPDPGTLQAPKDR
jgi:hypothetical protein